VHYLQKDGASERERKGNRVTHFAVKKNTQAREVPCFACGEKSHLIRQCKNPKNENVRPGPRKLRLSVSSQLADSQLYSTGRNYEDEKEYVEFQVDVSKTGKLKFLLDTGADICLIKSKNLLGTPEFDIDSVFKNSTRNEITHCGKAKFLY
jgi:hypothetical protein